MPWQITFEGEKDDSFALVEVLEETSEAVSCFEEDEAQGIWSVKSFYEEKPNLEEILEGTKLLHHLRNRIKLGLLPNKDWLKENRRGFPPLEIGSFYIYGSHIEAPPPEHKISFELNASTAFGTGEHGTTKGCLQALETLKDQGKTFSNPLDLGCGTGILAMGIARLFGVSVMAADNDPGAIEMAQENLEKNGLASKITALVSEGFEAPELSAQGPFDLITANILAGPLVELAPEMAEFCAPKGILILSGFYAYQKETLLRAYDPYFSEVEAQVEEDWMTLVMKRP